MAEVFWADDDLEAELLPSDSVGVALSGLSAGGRDRDRLREAFLACTGVA